MVRFHLLSFKFNEIIPLDKWKTTVLTKIQSLIPAEEDQQKPTQIEKETKKESAKPFNQNKDDDDEL
jgi:hypothetical protein